MNRTERIALLSRHGFFGKEVENNGRPSISLEKLMGRTFKVPDYRWIPTHDRHYCVYNELVDTDSKDGTAPRRKAEDVVAICNISADLDTGTLEEQFERIQGLPLLPSAAIFTGGKGIHIHYTLETRLGDINRGLEIQNALIQTVGGDTSCKDPSRLLAHPYAEYIKKGKDGTLKRGWPAVATCGIASGRRYTVEQLEDAFGRVPLKKVPTRKVSRAAKGECAQEDFWSGDLSFLDSIEPGDRLETLRETLYACKDRDLKDAFSILLDKKTFKLCPSYEPGTGDGDSRSELLSWCCSELNRAWYTNMECKRGVRGNDAGWVKIRSAFQRFLERWLPEDDRGRVSDAVGRAEKPIMSERCKFAIDFNIPNPTQVATCLYRKMKPSYNQLTKQLLTDGKPMTRLETLNRKLLLENIGHIGDDGRLVAFNKAETESTFIELAMTYFGFHPVRDYLNKVHKQGPSSKMDKRLWERLASHFFTGKANLDAPPTLADIQLRKWIVSAAKRTMQPGCKCDTMLVLKGEQGIGKSTFFRTLTGAVDGWFNDSRNMQDVREKDAIMGFHAAGVYEIQELKMQSKEIEAIKGFITTQTDSLRPPYSRLVETWPRSFVLCSTTNDNTFFIDETGNRRFWVIESPLKRGEKIDNKTLLSVRDDIWAWAMKDLAENYPIWLNEAEEALNDANNKTFQNEDPVEGMVEAALWGTDGEQGSTCPVFRLASGECLVNVTDIMDHAGGGGYFKRAGIPMIQRSKYICAIPRVLSRMGFAKLTSPKVVPERSPKRTRFFSLPGDMDLEKLNIVECKGR